MGMTPLPIEESFPKCKEIAWVVRSLCLNRWGGPSGMRAEHLYQWLQEATREEDPETTHWQKVVVIVQAAFRNGTLANDST